MGLFPIEAVPHDHCRTVVGAFTEISHVVLRVLAYRIALFAQRPTDVVDKLQGSWPYDKLKELVEPHV